MSDTQTPTPSELLGAEPVDPVTPGEAKAPLDYVNDALAAERGEVVDNRTDAEKRADALAPRDDDAEVTVDLDALRASRGNAKPTKKIRAGGRVFTVPSRLPIYVAAFMDAGEISKALKLWLGDDQEAVFRDTYPDLDATEFRELMRSLYGRSAGESAAS